MFSNPSRKKNHINVDKIHKNHIKAIGLHQQKPGKEMYNERIMDPKLWIKIIMVLATFGIVTKNILLLNTQAKKNKDANDDNSSSKDLCTIETIHNEPVLPLPSYALCTKKLSGASRGKICEIPLKNETPKFFLKLITNKLSTSDNEISATKPFSGKIHSERYNQFFVRDLLHIQVPEIKYFKEESDNKITLYYIASKQVKGLGFASGDDIFREKIPNQVAKLAILTLFVDDQHRLGSQNGHNIGYKDGELVAIDLDRPNIITMPLQTGIEVAIQSFVKYSLPLSMNNLNDMLSILKSMKQAEPPQFNDELSHSIDSYHHYIDLFTDACALTISVQKDFWANQNKNNYELASKLNNINFAENIIFIKKYTMCDVDNIILSLLDFIRKGDLQKTEIIIKLLERRKIDIKSLPPNNAANNSDTIEMMALYNAISFNHLKIVRFLIDRKVDIHQYYYQKEGNTPLYLATQLAIGSNDMSIVKLLIKNGADPGLYRPLLKHELITHRKKSIKLKELWKKLIRQKTRDKYDENETIFISPLDIAEASDNQKLIDLLKASMPNQLIHLKHLK